MCGQYIREAFKKINRPKLGFCPKEGGGVWPNPNFFKPKPQPYIGVILLQYGGGSPVPTKKSTKITNYQKKWNCWDKIPTLAIFLGLPWTGMMISSLSTRNTWYIMYGFRKTLLVQMRPSSQKNRDFCPVKRIMFTIWQKDIGRACLSEGGSENCWTLCTFETLNTSLQTV